MTLDYIASLTNSCESETLEFKTTTGGRREAAMMVCAFLNQGGGQVLFKTLLHQLMTGEVRVGELGCGDIQQTFRQSGW